MNVVRNGSMIIVAMGTEVLKVAVGRETANRPGVGVGVGVGVEVKVRGRTGPEWGRP